MTEEILFYKSLFDKEVDNCNELNKALNYPLTIVSLLIGVIYFLTSNISDNSNVLVCYVIYTTIGIQAILIVVSIYYLSLTYNNFLSGITYSDLPPAEELHRYKIQLINANAEAGSEQFNNYLSGLFRELADEYSETNMKRSRRLFVAKSFLIISVFFALVQVISFLFI